MVAGDLVNTASRIQSAAEPGTVLVGESTQARDRGGDRLRGRGRARAQGQGRAGAALPRAARDRRARGGALRSSGLEAPFVGRDRELRLSRSSSTPRRGAQGASRLGDRHRRHRQVAALRGSSRSTSTAWPRTSGGTVAAASPTARASPTGRWRRWCGCAAGSPRTRRRPRRSRSSARRSSEHIPDPEERALGRAAARPPARPRGAARPATRRISSPPGGSSSSGSQSEGPTVLVFEDMQWADAGLLDFLEYLLEWSRSHPIFVLALARPELAEQAADLGRRKAELRVALPRAARTGGDERAARRARTGPAARAARADPRARRGRAALRGRDGAHAARPRPARAGGQRLPADRPDRDARRAGDAARTHRRPARRPEPEERRLVQDGAVLGKTFTKQGLAAVTGLLDGRARAAARLALRKEILSIQADPRSPERGQYSFLQDIVKHVAYETISKRERKAQAPRGARIPVDRSGARRRTRSSRSSPPTTLTPTAAAPGRPGCRGDPLDGPRDAGAGCGARGSLAANAEAQRAYERAIELADEPRIAGGLHERAGVMARTGARTDEAAAHFERAIELFETAGAKRMPAARVSARLAEILRRDRGRIEQGLESMERAFDLLSRGGTRRGSRVTSGTARALPLLRGRERRRTANGRDGARARRGTSAAGDVLTGAEHEGDHPGRGRPRSRRGSPCCATRSKSRSRTTSRQPRFARTTTWPTHSLRPIGMRRLPAHSRRPRPRPPCRQPVLGVEPARADPSVLRAWAVGRDARRDGRAA